MGKQSPLRYSIMSNKLMTKSHLQILNKKGLLMYWVNSLADEMN